MSVHDIIVLMSDFGNLLCMGYMGIPGQICSLEETYYMYLPQLDLILGTFFINELFLANA